MINDRNEQALAAWRKLLEAPKIRMDTVGGWGKLLKLADKSNAFYAQSFVREARREYNYVCMFAERLGTRKINAAQTDTKGVDIRGFSGQ